MASVLGVQVPLLIVHTKVFTPVVKPVTPEVGGRQAAQVFKNHKNEK